MAALFHHFVQLQGHVQLSVLQNERKEVDRRQDSWTKVI